MIKKDKQIVHFECCCGSKEILVPLGDYLVKGLGYVIPHVLCEKCLLLLAWRIPDDQEE